MPLLCVKEPALKLSASKRQTQLSLEMASTGQPDGFPSETSAVPDPGQQHKSNPDRGQSGTSFSALPHDVEMGLPQSRSAPAVHSGDMRGSDEDSQPGETLGQVWTLHHAICCALPVLGCLQACTAETQMQLVLLLQGLRVNCTLPA